MASTGSGTTRTRPRSRPSVTRLTHPVAAVAASAPWVYSGSTAATAHFWAAQIAVTGRAHRRGGQHDRQQCRVLQHVHSSLTPTSPGVPNSTTGTMRIAMSLDGNLSVTGTGTAGMVFRYDYGSPRPGYPAINRTLLETSASIYGNGYQIYGPHSYLGSYTTPAGMALDVGPANARGSLRISPLAEPPPSTPISPSSSAPAPFRMGLQTFTGIGNGKAVSSLFANTATMTGIQLFTNQGKIWTSASPLAQAHAVPARG